MNRLDDVFAATMREELERQTRNLYDLGYPALAGIGDDEFDRMLGPVRELVLDGLSAAVKPPAEGRIPFLVVVKGEVVPTEAAVHRWAVGGRTGWTDMADELPTYRPIEGLDLPSPGVYLLLDVDTGADTLNVPPEGALPIVTAGGRTPLTIDEGVALVTHFPRVFETHNAFQALGSRAPNKRIPSFWVSKGAPRLGWCWAGNPHRWLGAASAAGRHPR